MGNLTGRPSRGGEIEPEVSGFKWLFFSGAEVANSYKHVFGRDGKAFWSEGVGILGIQSLKVQMPGVCAGRGDVEVAS